jgi:hypothetical protein
VCNAVSFANLLNGRIVALICSLVSVQVAAAQMVPTLLGIRPEVAFASNERRSIGKYRPTRRIAISGPPEGPFEEDCGGIALAGIDREYRGGVERCRSTPQSHSEVTFRYPRPAPLENLLGPVPCCVISSRLRLGNADARQNSFTSFARTAN